MQPEASVVQTGLGIRYISGWAYAYSGSVGATDPETDLLNFTTGSGLIDAFIQFNYIAISGNDFQYAVYFNDLLIQGYSVAESGATATADNFIKLLIPPFTAVRLTALNLSGATSRQQAVSLTGRVYGAE